MVVNYEKMIEDILGRQYYICGSITCTECFLMDECCKALGDGIPGKHLTKGEFVKGIKKELEVEWEENNNE